MEPFSGRGPVTSVFAPVNGTTPSAAFGSPITLSKPDVSATDGGITTFFGGGNRFSGTSAAAPHAAAVGALQLAANPGLTRNQIEAAQKATARPVGAFGPLDMGAGLIDAQAAIASTPPAAPSIAITNRPGPTTNDSTPTFEFTVTGHPNTVSCNVDGVAQACTSPFTPAAALADGNHTVTISATDFFGQASSPSAASFTTDTTAPSAPKFGKGPKKKTSKSKAKFTFSSEAGATFMCALDKKAFAACTSPAKVKVKKAKPKKKKHSFAVEAIDAAGNVGAAATYKWKVQK
jgi:subtilisin family serine protease